MCFVPGAPRRLGYDLMYSNSNKHNNNNNSDDYYYYYCSTFIITFIDIINTIIIVHYSVSNSNS